MYLTPNPIAFTIFSLQIRWYAVLILSGIILGIILSIKRLKEVNIDPDIFYDMIIFAMPLGVICARAYYVLFNLSYYLTNTNEIYKIWHGGLAIHGGIIGALIGVYLVCKYRKVNFLKFIDVVAPSILLAQAIGRWGNYFNMEAYGRQTTLPWAINVIDSKLGSIMVHPTFLYESIWDFAMFLLLYFVLYKKKKYDGEVFCYYLIFYSIGRFFVEGFRTDSLMFLGLRMAQVISIILIIIGVISLLYLKKKNTNITKE